MWTIIIAVVLLIAFWVVRTLTSKRMRFWRIANRNPEAAFCFFMANPEAFIVATNQMRLDRNVHDAGPFVFFVQGNRIVLYANSDTLESKQQEFVRLIQAGEVQRIYRAYEEYSARKEYAVRKKHEMHEEYVNDNLFQQGESVDLTDGRSGEFIGFLSDGVTVQVAIEDEQIGELITTEVHKSKIVGLSTTVKP